MITVVSFIIVLGILITVHELGHFLVAKAIGLGVERFSIGFPPKMFGITIGETEYCVSWIPLGGYVKLIGENPDEALKGVDNQKHFMSRPPHQRAAVTIAGPLMNLVLAFLLMPMVFFIGVACSVLTEAPRYLRKLGYPFKKFFDKLEHSEKLFAPLVVLGISAFITFLDFYSTRYGVLLTSPYWSYAFTFFIWLVINTSTLLTYNSLKMPLEFSVIKNTKI